MKRVITSNTVRLFTFSLLLLAFCFLLLLSCSNPKLDNPFDLQTTLAAPSNLVIEQTSVTSCKLTWTDNATNEQGFRIDRKKDNETWQVGYAEVAANVTELTETSLICNSTYSYRIYGFTGDNTSSPLENSFDNIIPAPESLTYTLENVTWPNADVHLEWDYTMAGIDGFKVKKNGTLLDDMIPAGTTEWIDTGVNIINSNSYQIVAFFQDTMSAYSNEVIANLTFPGMIFVQGGSFEMGDHFNEGSTAELPVHTVTLDNFFIGTHEVTQDEYEAVVGSNPAHSYGVGDDYPVYNVSWYDAVTYCNLKSQQEGLTPCYNLTDWSCDFSTNGYRLPTEAEWEYAARGGINCTDDYRYSGCHEESDLQDYTWYYSNSSSQTHEVGTKLPNQLGIYDMSGNVREWCNDRYDNNYYTSSPASNPIGPVSGYNRVLRGGSWNDYEYYCRVAVRYYGSPDYSNYNYGFRILRTP